MKPKILLHKFRFPVFKGSIWVIVGNNLEKAIDYAEDLTSQKIASEKDKKIVKAYAYAYEAENGRRKYILFFKHTAKPGEIAHEVKHLINILFSWHGFKLSLSNDEMECYYLEDIMDKVIAVIKKYKKLNKID
jgi:hypothetical protein